MKITPALSRALVIGFFAAGSFITSVYYQYPETYAHYRAKLTKAVFSLRDSETVQKFENEILPEVSRTGLSLEVLNEEDFVIWTQKILSSFPQKEDLKIKNPYHIRRDLVGAGEKLTELALFLKANPQWKQLGAEFLNQCANKKDIIGAVRGLCLARMESMYGGVGGEPAYKP